MKITGEQNEQKIHATVWHISQPEVKAKFRILLIATSLSGMNVTNTDPIMSQWNGFLSSVMTEISENKNRMYAGRHSRVHSSEVQLRYLLYNHRQKEKKRNMTGVQHYK